MISTKLLLSVAAGGAVGAASRYVVSSYVTHFAGSEYPFGTLTVNIVGAIVMGALVTLLGVAWSPGPEIRAFLTTGVLGGFTTFSLFSLDMAVMIERGDVLTAGGYAAASVFLCVAGFFVGTHMMRPLL